MTVLNRRFYQRELMRIYSSRVLGIAAAECSFSFITAKPFYPDTNLAANLFLQLT